MGKPSIPRQRLAAMYSFPGFRAHSTVRDVIGDPQVRVLALDRRSKKPSAAPVVACIVAGTIGKFGSCATSRAASGTSILRWRFGASIAERAVS
jgi:hypothetical protein